MSSSHRFLFVPITFLLVVFCVLHSSASHAAEPWKLATFSAEVTIPLGHRCMGILPTKSKSVADPLFVKGWVWLGSEKPIVLAAVDWCEIRNGAYDQWRDALAKAVGTTRQRVLVCSLHQHDAPVTDSDAAQLLAAAGLKGELYDEDFHQQVLNRVAQAAKESLPLARPITHIGMGQAKVEQVASNRRVVHPDGKVSFERGSRSGGDPFHREAPDGEIDPYLKTLSFWHQDQPVAALHAYAVHPMSYYGRGEVTADFVGMARQRRQKDDLTVHQMYVSGCSGDVTAGKYNDGSPPLRPALADRLYQAMLAAWKTTRRVPLEKISFRSTELSLDFSLSPSLSEAALKSRLNDAELPTEKRVLAAMGLASLQRVQAGKAIDFPCLDFGPAQLVLFPGESFVGYQLHAQRMRPDSFVVSLGYGECWPGYIPTESAFADQFRDVWLWVPPGSEAKIHAALQKVLKAE